MPKKDLEPGDVTDERLEWLKRRLSKRLSPKAALAGMRRAMSDLAQQNENYRYRFEQRLRQRLKLIAKHPKRKLAPEESEAIRLLLGILHLMEIQGN